LLSVAAHPPKYIHALVRRDCPKTLTLAMLRGSCLTSGANRRRCISERISTSAERTQGIPAVASLLGSPHSRLIRLSASLASLKGVDFGGGLALPLENIAAIRQKNLIKNSRYGEKTEIENRP